MSISKDFNDKLRSLADAVDFREKCKAYSYALETGATRDAEEWVNEAAAAVVEEWRSEGWDRCG